MQVTETEICAMNQLIDVLLNITVGTKLFERLVQRFLEVLYDLDNALPSCFSMRSFQILVSHT